MFNLNFKRLYTFVPRVLRSPITKAYIEVMLFPIHDLYIRFMNKRLSFNYRIDHTPQVWSLEKVLNDRFDNEQRRITITDGERSTFTSIYRKEENAPKFLGTIYITGSESIGNSVDFIVNVPSNGTGIFLSNTLRNSMIAVLNYYKLASKTYRIVAK